MDACGANEVKVISTDAEREGPLQCTRCLSTNAISGTKQYLHPGEGPDGEDVCDMTPCGDTEGAQKYAQLVTFASAQDASQVEEQRLCAASCEANGAKQLQTSADNYMCTKSCAPDPYYMKTDTGALCAEKCELKVSADESLRHGDASLCTSRCEGTYGFVLNGKENVNWCVSACAEFYAEQDGQKLC